jgi:tetratricopeptide (TPR) repeat protein
MRKRPSDSDPDEDLFVKEFDGALAALQTADCPDPRMLAAQAEGVLPEKEAAGVRAHLEQCKCCQQLAWQMAALGETDSTPEARERILARVRAAANPVRPQRRWREAKDLWPWTLVPLAASAALFFVLSTDGPEPIPPTAAVTSEEANEPAPLRLAALIPMEQAPIELPLEAVLTMRAEPDPYYSALVAALVPYKEGRYEEASLKLGEVTERYPGRAEAQFYLGVSDLMQGNAEDAIPRLETADKLSEENLKRMAGWYLAQAYLHTSNAEAAAGKLKPLCASSGDYQQQACTALERLDEARKE